jgi:hypothetical protein
VATAKFDRSLRDGASAGCVSKIRRNKIRCTSRGAEFVDCLLPALRIASHNQNANAQLCQFIGRRTTNSAGSTSDKGCRSVCHGNSCGAIYEF